MSAQGARWAWHTADENGVTRKHSDSDFDDFNACVDDARAHGYRHVEVPVLHWSVAAGAASRAVVDASSVEQDDPLDGEFEQNDAAD